jgi:hypothetical protein
VPDEVTYGALATASRRRLLEVPDHDTEGYRLLAEMQHPGVVCAVHLGLLRGIVEQATAGAADARLSPFGQPRLCATDLVASHQSSAR